MGKEIPSYCQGCAKTGMAAINCPFFPRLVNELALIVQCADAHESKESRKTSGGRFLGRKPNTVNSGSGKTKRYNSKRGSE